MGSFSSVVDVEKIIEQFAISGVLQLVEPVAQGRLNDTWMSSWIFDGRVSRYVHQGVNASVFPHPEVIMESIERVGAHLRALGADYPFQTLETVRTRDGRGWLHASGQRTLWRTYRYIENSVTYDATRDRGIAGEAGWAIGMFLRALDSMPTKGLQAAIPGFQNIVGRYEALEDAKRRDLVGRVKSVQELLAEASAGLPLAQKVSRIMNNPAYQRMTHADTKLNNVLFDRDTHGAICMIDLDTVMVGSPLYDFGDFIRMICITSSEDELGAMGRESVDMDLLAAAAQGFWRGIGASYLHDEERAVLADMPAVLSHTLGVRFLTDYLNGDVYFPVDSPEQNRVRAVGQFAVAASFLSGKRDIEETIERARESAFSAWSNTGCIV